MRASWEEWSRSGGGSREARLALGSRALCASCRRLPSTDSARARPPRACRAIRPEFGPPAGCRMMDAAAATPGAPPAAGCCSLTARVPGPCRGSSPGLLQHPACRSRDAWVWQALCASCRRVLTVCVRFLLVPAAVWLC